MSRKLVTAISEIHEDEALRLVNEALDNGEDPASIMSDCQAAMEIVGSRYERGEYFLPELTLSGLILRKISDIVKPKLAARNASGGGGKRAGKVVLGTVRGDIHDVGKDVVGFMLDVNGFEVHDLGIDVPEAKFVETIEEVKPQVVALSGFLTANYEVMKSTVEAIEKAGLRKNVKIMIGGGMVDEIVKNYTGADAYGVDAIAAVKLAKEWTTGR